MKELYLPSGYLNFQYIYSLKTPFIFIWGGRGIGKTYGAIEEAINQEIRTIFFRRRQTQVDLIFSQPKFNPFRPVCEDHGWEYRMKKLNKYNNEIQITTFEKDFSFGYTAALSTFANLRGFSLPEVDNILYDEFIGEAHEDPIKNEGLALANAYESINRNRELQGRDPVKLVCLTNSNNLINPVFMTFGVLRNVINMIQRGQEVETLPDRGITLINALRSPISERKKETALYKAVADKSFTDMAIRNIFPSTINVNLKSFSLRELKPFIEIGEIMIYKLKNSDGFYVSPHKMVPMLKYNVDDQDLMRFQKVHRYLDVYYVANKIYFETLDCDIIFRKYFYGY